MIVRGINMKANRYCRQTTSARMGTPLIRLLAISAAMKRTHAAIQGSVSMPNGASGTPRVSD
jgi:hypothetical protein